MVRGTNRCRDRRVAAMIVGILPSLLYVVRGLTVGNHANGVRSVLFLLESTVQNYENAGTVVASTKSTLNKRKKIFVNLKISINTAG